jgi:hypothetical protein
MALSTNHSIPMPGVLINASSIATTVEPTEDETGSSSVLIGAVLCLFAACTLALSMNVQCFALTSSESDFSRLASIAGSCLSRKAVWSFGLLLYAAANGFYVIGLGFAPLSLMSALFATVLVFNAICEFIWFAGVICFLGTHHRKILSFVSVANRFLGEEVQSSDIWGLLIIVCSVSVCGYGSNIEVLARFRLAARMQTRPPAKKTAFVYPPVQM